MESVVGTRESPIWQDSRALALLMAASLTTMANATISQIAQKMSAAGQNKPSSTPI